MGQNKGIARIVVFLPALLSGICTLLAVIVGTQLADAFLSPVRVSSPFSAELENQLVSGLASDLKSLESIATWSFVALGAAVISAVQGETKVKVGSFEIGRQHAGVVVFAVLCGLTFQAMRLLQNLAYALSQITINAEQAKLIIRTNPWLLNPFSETSGIISPFTDNWGYALLLILWWFGFHTGIFLLQGASTYLKRIGYLLMGLYLLFGLISMFIISRLIAQVNVETGVIKQIILFGAIPVGAFGIGYMFRQFNKRPRRATGGET